ncbi:MAG: hypothetical protein KatS3mg076_0511 [Candidatus Binatia bacterium]|nr:MAG: hypothetical protein KatS3mg076_0511 [Candidatus Binatia bacterium]
MGAKARPSEETRRPHWVLFAAIVTLALALRVHDLRDLPAGLFCDEAALGYNAWAIAHYGIDENGVRWPLFVWSFGGYKNPVFIYAAAIPIRLLGLDEFTTRLPSALFGTGTVAAAFFLGRALLGTWVGLWFAALLAIVPWHLHFSRIAFELVSFPFLFVLGFVFLVRFAQGRKTLPLAFFFLAACPYAYAISKLFVPLFLLGFGLLYLPTLWRRPKEWLVAVPVLLLTAAPVVWFDLTHRRGMNYFYNTTILRPGLGWEEFLRIYARNYAEFFSPRFLFEAGDPIVRHAVRGHGELYPFFLPFLLLGLLVLLFRRDRATKLVLWWLALYPAGAALMTEIPSASRGFIGAPAFCLVTAAGIGAFFRAIGWIGRRRSLALSLQALGLVGLASAAYPEIARYLHLYFREYVKYSAPTYGGFQYGYREVIEFMEPRRKDYDLLMLTATEVNQPYIFALFYTRKDPREFARTHDPGYLVLDPSEYRRYSMDRRILYSLRPSDLQYFSDYDVLKEVVAPGGQVEFVIAEVRKRKNYITDWMVLGPFDNRGGQGLHREFLDVAAIEKKQYPGKYGPVFWRRISPQFIRVDLNVFFAWQDRDHPGNPEYACAYALTTVEAPTARPALLEMWGSEDPGKVWLNGELLTPVPERFGERPKTREVALREGRNVLLVKSCEIVGGWYFVARLTDLDGRDFEDLRYVAEIPASVPPPPPAERTRAEELEVVEGFAEIVRFVHTQESYPDYRGGTRSWWTYERDAQAEVVWRTAPVPAKKTTAFVFTASMGEESGRAELWVDGKYALEFDLGIDFDARKWERGGYRLFFRGKQLVAGKSGVFVLVLPASEVEPGRPVELRVVPTGGHPNAWFMVKDYRDTAAFEQMTPEIVAALEAPGWVER